MCSVVGFLRRISRFSVSLRPRVWTSWIVAHLFSFLLSLAFFFSCFLPFPFVVVWRSRTHGLLRQNVTTSRQNFVPPKILVGVVGTPSRLSGHYAKQGIFHQICQWYHQQNQYLDCDGHAKTTGNSRRSRKNGRYSRMGTIVRRRTRHCDESIGGQ